MEASSLVFDADDTLWENNVHFERALGEFVRWLDHPSFEDDAIRATFTAIQRANVAAPGYGPAMFARSLGDCVAQLRGRPVTELERADIESMAATLTRAPVELIVGVEETLAEPASRYGLFLIDEGRNCR